MEKLMNWDAIGAIGEIIGALTVIFTLAILIFQIKQSTKATIESNQLERANALGHHAESISRWRGRIAENEDLSQIWLKAKNDTLLTEIELLRVITYGLISAIPTI
ncbi:MAG: hypothetical protein ACI9CE_001829 [Flavobacterium sp.]|jgi:hypothetical protein